jgi:hypothetical protein
MNAETAGLPDLLRRFVATPHISTFAIKGFHVTLETNDTGLIQTLETFLAGCDSASQPQTSYWKLIRDELAPCGGREITVVPSGSMHTLLIGLGTLVVIDRERREVLGFIALDFSEADLATIALPRILNLLLSQGSRCLDKAEAGPGDDTAVCRL